MKSKAMLSGTFVNITWFVEYYMLELHIFVEM